LVISHQEEEEAWRRETREKRKRKSRHGAGLLPDDGWLLTDDRIDEVDRIDGVGAGGAFVDLGWWGV